MQSRQTRTTKNNTPYKEGLKSEQGSVLGTQTQENADNGTIVEKVHLSRDLYYNTQGIYARYVHRLFRRNTLFRIKQVIFLYKRR
jgi:hypothetical protein